MKSSFCTQMARMYGRTLELQASMTEPLGTDEQFVNIGQYLPKVVKSKMARIHGFRFRMKLHRENEVNDLDIAVTLSVQGAAKAAMEGGTSQENLQELVGNVIRGVYDEDDVDGKERCVPTLPPLPAAVEHVYNTPQRGGGYDE